MSNPRNLPAFAGIDSFPLFFGIAIYAYEGIGLVRNLQQFNIFNYIAIRPIKPVFDFNKHLV